MTFVGRHHAQQLKDSKQWYACILLPVRFALYVDLLYCSKVYVRMHVVVNSVRIRTFHP